jgi:cell division protein FtsQ
MGRSLTSKFSTKRHRAKRRLGQVFLDVLKALLLTGFVFMLSALLIYAYNYSITRPYFRIQETVVRGCSELTEKDILLLADVKASHNLLAVNLEALSQRVARNPWVKKAFIGRELPNRLVIEVQERKAVAVIRQGNEMFLLDGEGVAFKKRDPVDDADLPILTGFYKDGTLDAGLVDKSLALLRHLEASTEFPTLSVVSEIHGDEVLGFSLYTDTGLCLQLGFDSYENKLKRLAPVMADLDRKNLKSIHLNIDLSDPAKITVRRTDITGPQEQVDHDGLKNKYRT